MRWYKTKTRALYETKKGVRVNLKNKEKINKILSKIQEKGTSNMITYENISEEIKKIERELKMISKKNREGVSVRVNYFIKDLPLDFSRREAPTSTYFWLKFVNGNWKLTKIDRLKITWGWYEKEFMFNYGNTTHSC
jgi:hypothetical protein